MKTYSAKAKEIIPQWHVIDAAEQPLGRMAARIASLLRGKHRPQFTPHMDMRDFVVVVNAEKVRVSGNNKMRQKVYRHHTQYPGGLREITLEKMMAKHPTRVIEHAVRGMLPHNRLGAKLRGHLKVYVGPEHPHTAQTGGAPKKPRKAAVPAGPKARTEIAVAEAVVEEPAEAIAEEPAESPSETAMEEPAETLVVEEPEGAPEAEAQAEVVAGGTQEESSS
ncbi:MAG: 50S ribosomal protein L13 [Dehalococcoidia bacterium]|jgi:large subunit ribosomal protein L13